MAGFLSIFFGTSRPKKRAFLRFSTERGRGYGLVFDLL